MNIRFKQIAKLKEELALHEQTEAAYAAWQKNPAVPLQYKWDFNEWSDMDQQPLSWYPTEGCHYRIKPTPRLRPWTFNDRPREVTWVYRKGFITDCQIVAWGDDMVVIAGKQGLVNQTYDQLLKDWLCRDSNPCGVQE